MSQSRLIELSYYDPKAKVRLTAYADTLVLDEGPMESTTTAIRFGGYPEMVNAMAAAIHGGAAIDATIRDESIRFQCIHKGYTKQLSHDGVYATATLMANDQAQEAINTEEQEDKETPEQPRTCYIFCPAGDRDRLFEELDHKTAAPLIPEFQEQILDALIADGSLRRMKVYALKSSMLRCVNLMFTKDGLKAAGSDGHCVATAKGDANSTGDIAMMVPAASLGTLARISNDKDTFQVGTTGKSIVFMKKDLFFSARILDGEYIDTDRLIAKLTNRFTVLADMEELRDTLYSTVSIDPDGTLMLGFDGNLLYTRCDSEYAKAVNSMSVIPLTGTPKGEYWYRSRQLMECLRVTEGMTTIGVAQNGLLTVSTENSYYFQSPVRAPATVRKAPDPAPKAA